MYDEIAETVKDGARIRSSVVTRMATETAAALFPNAAVIVQVRHGTSNFFTTGFTFTSVFNSES